MESAKSAILTTALALAGMCSPAAELFNGRDLSGWTSVCDHDIAPAAAQGPTWSVVDGAIRTTGSPFGYLRTKRTDFGDFTLRLEYRWWRPSEKANSGVFVRLDAENASFIPRCYENQLWPKKVCDVCALGGATIDGQAPRNPFVATDPLSGIACVPAKAASTEKPVGEWNVLEITVTGDEVSNRLNGTELNRVKGLRTRKGAIGLQSEGGAIEFRNITVDEVRQNP